MALRFLDSFNAYATADIGLRYDILTTVSSNPTIDGGSGRFGGGNSLKFAAAGSGSFLGKTLDAQSEWIVGFGLFFTNTGGTPFICGWESGTDVQIFMGINAANKLYLVSGNSLTTIATSATALIASTWYYIEWKLTIASSSTAGTNIVRVWDTGVSTDHITLPAATNTNPASTGTANKFFLESSSTSANTHFCDLYIFDGTGSINNDFVGDSRIDLMNPTGLGSQIDWTTVGSGSPSAYAVVSETTQDGDTTYISDNTVNHENNYTWSSLSSSSFQVYGLQLTAVARYDDGGPHSFKFANNLIGQIQTLGSSISVTGSYAYYSSQFNKDCNASPWTPTTMNALEAGVVLAV